MKNLALKRIQKMKPYSPPLNGRSNFKGILLDFNERTVTVNKKVIKALENFIKKSKVQVYPEYFDLCEKIAKYTGVNADQIMLTNGSDNGMDIIFRTFTEVGDKAIIPAPSFAMFYQCAEIAGNEIMKPLYKKEDLSFPTDEVLEMIDDKVKIIVICNPNNPTATVVDLETIERIAKKASNAIVYVDEAYFEFCGVSSVGLIKKYPNIIVTRTFSKAFGLPSLRIGYTIASKENIDEMMKVRGPYDVNMPAYFSALAVMDDLGEMRKYVDEVMKKAKPMVEKFFDKNSVKYYKSGSNFILFKPEDADVTYKKLLE
ncbi:MAG: histidinol-phosphate transaminase, partial [Candidatus Gracilibacteria bacterium]